VELVWFLKCANNKIVWFGFDLDSKLLSGLVMSPPGSSQVPTTVHEHGQIQLGNLSNIIVLIFNLTLLEINENR